MKAIMMMFDTLTRKYLSAYGNGWVSTPNFKRLEEHTVVFDQFYASSLPCMPARRDFHTGRSHFLHRMWGPLEPFDESVAELLKEQGVYTHLVTDHSHYWEDGGATYHTRYSSWQGFRGQEGDRWMPSLGPGALPARSRLSKTGDSVKQNYANRKSFTKPGEGTEREGLLEERMPSVRTVRAGLDFIGRYHDEDRWFLQIECFDPHEPFVCPEEYGELYEKEAHEEAFDWPAYQKVDSRSDEEELRHFRSRYAALITLCDKYLGKVLDEMDAYQMWDDTMLIVNTDHGFLLGEHDWMGKNIQPVYDEIAHLPFFLWDPRCGKRGVRRSQLSQTIDIAPTLLDYFGIEHHGRMDGRSLRPVLERGESIHDVLLFGVHGGHVNMTDGKYVYMKCAASPDNQPLFDYTLMPARMRGFIARKQLDGMELVDGGRYSGGMKVLRIPSEIHGSTCHFGNLLFYMEEDPDQERNLADGGALEQEYRRRLVRKMQEAGAPTEQYERLGLEISGQEKI